MKRILFIAACMAMTLQALAQGQPGSWTFIPKVGFNSASTTDPDIYLDVAENAKVKVRQKLGFVVGGEAEYQWNDLMALSVGLLYSQQGFKFDDTADWRNVKVSLDYLNVPLMVSCYVARGLSVKAGLQGGLLVRQQASEDNLVEDGGWEHYTESGLSYKTLELGVPVGVAYAIGPVQVEVRYNIGLTYIHKAGSLFPERNRVWLFTVGYRF